MLLCAAYHTYFSLSAKCPSPVAKFLLFRLIYRLKLLRPSNMDKKGIHTRNQRYDQALQERGNDKLSVKDIPGKMVVNI